MDPPSKPGWDDGFVAAAGEADQPPPPLRTQSAAHPPGAPPAYPLGAPPAYAFDRPADIGRFLQARLRPQRRVATGRTAPGDLSLALQTGADAATLAVCAGACCGVSEHGVPGQGMGFGVLRAQERA